MAQEARMAAGAAKSKGSEFFPICPLFKNYYQIDTRFSLGTNIESCSVILNASYQFWI